MSREVMWNGKTLQMRLWLDEQRQQRCAPHQDHGDPPHSIVQGLWAEVHAQEPEVK